MPPDGRECEGLFAELVPGVPSSPSPGGDGLLRGTGSACWEVPGEDAERFIEEMWATTRVAAKLRIEERELEARDQMWWCGSTRVGRGSKG